MKRTTSLLLAAAGGALLRRRARRPGARPSGILGPEAVRDLYDRLAPVYDAVAGAYDLVGAGGFHRRAVAALGLRPGDTAVDLACGTGANLRHLVRAVGPAGRVVGVDLSPGMLARAQQRIDANGWTTVTLVRADVRSAGLPEPLHGAVSTFGLEMVPEVDAVVASIVAALVPGGRIAVGGLRRPDGWPEWAVRLGEFVNRPFGVTRAYEAIQPWRAVEARASDVHVETALFGAAYLATGHAPGAQPSTL